MVVRCQPWALTPLLRDIMDILDIKKPNDVYTKMTELFPLDRFCHFSTISYEIFVYNLFDTHYENNVDRYSRHYYHNVVKIEGFPDFSIKL